MNVHASPARLLLSEAEKNRRQGRHAQAAALYHDVLKRFPSNMRARAGLSILTTTAFQAITPAKIDDLQALMAQGENQAALKQAQVLDLAAPGHPALLHIIARSLRALGRAEEAVALCDRALQTHDTSTLWSEKAAALMQAERPARAAAALDRATALDPDGLDNWVRLAICRLDMALPRQALIAADAALRLDPQNAECWKVRGDILTALGQTGDARKAFENALLKLPDDIDTLHQIAMLSDRPAHVEKLYRRALERHPNDPILHRRFSEMAGPETADARISQMQDLLAQSIDDEAKAQLHFGLFNAFDQLDDVTQAFTHLQAANTLRGGLQPYNLTRDVALFRLLKDLKLPEAPRGRPAVNPIFIVGLPRSGATVVERLLAAGGHAHPAGALNVVEASIRPLHRAWLSDGRQHLRTEEIVALQSSLRVRLTEHVSDHKCIIDCTPMNFRWIGLLRAALPEARFVFVQRGAVAQGWALFRSCFDPGINRFAYDLRTIARFQAMTSDLIRHWQATGTELISIAYDDLQNMDTDTITALQRACGLMADDAETLTLHDRLALDVTGNLEKYASFLDVLRQSDPTF